MEIQSNRDVALEFSNRIKEQATSFEAIEVEISASNTLPTNEAKSAASHVTNSLSLTKQTISNASSMLVEIADTFTQIDQG